VICDIWSHPQLFRRRYDPDLCRFKSNHKPGIQKVMHRALAVKPLVLAVVLAIPAAWAEENPAPALDDVVVTAPRMTEPLKVVTDPKAPRQPVPAHDGADYLKNIPGFSVIRKGGTDGDPVLRGMAGSRLNILLDGEQILGGCGGRMDPPTAYVFPEAYDRITVIKGPQSVLNGPGTSAGAVLFERDVKRFDPAGWNLNGSLTLGSFGRHDEVVDVRGGTPDFYAQTAVTNTTSDDYKDGDGHDVHSQYKRWSANAAVGWTPSANTRLEFSGANSDGEAAYADRTMDGVLFKRSNYGVKLQMRNLSSVVNRIEAQTYYNYIDHVMDNYSLRTKTAAMYMINNPDRETTGARLLIGLTAGDSDKLSLGVDTQRNMHTLRTASSAASAPAIETGNRVEDAQFANTGVFGELTHYFGERDRAIAGLRSDKWVARDKRATITLGSGMSATTVANPTANEERNETLTSGFARYEHDLADGPTTVYAGLGRSERFPDYWELISASKESADTISAFNTQPEKTTQLDVGAIHKSGGWSYSVSAFYNRISDYILIQSNVVKTGPARTITITRNVDATTFGTEAGIGYAFAESWKTDVALAYVRGDNETDGTPLAQLPPLEGRLGVTYDNRTWSAGALLRVVGEQNRYDVNKGNIVGQDLGHTGGFSVFSINGSYRPAKSVLLSGGVDNVGDKAYAEHISKTGQASISGYEQTTRVNEPGRYLWLKANVTF
jgi:iron complex outermembrane recepter protein